MLEQARLTRDGGTAISKTRVIYGDTDMMGVAYYGNYLRWFEMGRNELIRLRGFTYRQMEERGFVLPVVEAHVKYLKSAQYDDVIEVHTRVSEVGRVHVNFEYEVHRTAEGKEPELLATGFTEHACLSREARKPERLPEDVAEILRGFAAKKE